MKPAIPEMRHAR